MPMALQTSQLFIGPQCSCHFTSEKSPPSSLYTSLNLSPAKSLSCLRITSTTLCKRKRDSPLTLHLPFDDDANPESSLGWRVKKPKKCSLSPANSLSSWAYVQPLLPIHSALYILPEWVRWVTLAGTILVLDLLDSTFLHLLNNLTQRACTEERIELQLACLQDSVVIRLSRRARHHQ